MEDVGQEVFVRLYDSLKQLRKPQVFEPWLYRLTINACYDYLRRKRREMSVRMADLKEEQVIAVDAALSGKKALEESEKESARELLELLLDRVSTDDRILLTLKEIQGLSLKELSVVYKVNTNALKVRLFRARKRALRAYDQMTEEARQQLLKRKEDESHAPPIVTNSWTACSSCIESFWANSSRLRPSSPRSGQGSIRASKPERAGHLT